MSVQRSKEEPLADWREIELSRFPDVPGMLGPDEPRFLLHSYGAERASEAARALEQRVVGDERLRPHMETLRSEVESRHGMPPPFADRLWSVVDP